MCDEVLLQQVRQLRAQGASPKAIARALRVPPAKVAPLVRLIAAQNAEPQRRPDVVECWISPGWHEGLTFQPHTDWPVNPSAPDGAGGLVAVMVARPDQRSRSRVCVYLVDTFCLGVKNVMGPKAVSDNALHELRRTVFAGYDHLAVPAPLELAQHLVFGAVEFARGLGFEPHPDFAAAADHLGAWSGRCPIQFGYKGTPYYIQGPHDDVESIARTLASTPAAPLHLESTVITEQPNEGQGVDLRGAQRAEPIVVHLPRYERATGCELDAVGRPAQAGWATPKGPPPHCG